MGIFYFNPSDKRLFVPKRISAFGLTLNFGHPYAGIALLLIIALIIFLVKFF